VAAVASHLWQAGIEDRDLWSHVDIQIRLAASLAGADDKLTSEILVAISKCAALVAFQTTTW
jgi:hypothetical protein